MTGKRDSVDSGLKEFREHSRPGVGGGVTPRPRGHEMKPISYIAGSFGLGSPFGSILDV